MPGHHCGDTTRGAGRSCGRWNGAGSRDWSDRGALVADERMPWLVETEWTGEGRPAFSVGHSPREGRSGTPRRVCRDDWGCRAGVRCARCASSNVTRPAMVPSRSAHAWAAWRKSSCIARVGRRGIVPSTWGCSRPKAASGRQGFGDLDCNGLTPFPGGLKRCLSWNSATPCDLEVRCGCCGRYDGTASGPRLFSEGRSRR